jgi:glycine cleavage system aminomethyltransferase T
VKPAGLGSRDSLRLEAGLCLYGNDIDENTNPVEGNLLWTIGGPKSRRRTQQGFLGAEHFLEKDGKPKPVQMKRVGLSGMKAPARGHTEIFSADGKTKIGEITSGGFGPNCNHPVAMGYQRTFSFPRCLTSVFFFCRYVSTANAVDGTAVKLSVRGKLHDAKVFVIFSSLLMMFLILIYF